MKKIVISLFLIACSSMAHAQLRDWAVGVKVGQPTGLNLRKYGDRNAFDLTVGPMAVCWVVLRITDREN
ncbi:hypothetical protein BWI96_15710 [Siphonobacter sp. SORGH_AS_0500]|uniref:hypothetical protein n=1 Tax=Siphonobacter sp. SORGH_AS_0500 TaxID=1864824 RepID=UPI000CB3AFD4|nr:hypothetical protein [Siphonobacter sp. SORGH_AS_0500]PKK35748.1 hypothetical protein BWI96_15710 [Siphonobacter sp. SORGH_AS_0500]